MTGVTYVEYTLGGKWLEMLKEIAPSVTRVAVIHNSENRLVAGFLPAIEAVAPSLGVQLTPTSVRNVGLIVLPDVLAVVNRELIIALAARHRLPAIYGFRYRGMTGGLISHGVDTAEAYRQAASYVDRIHNRPNSSWRSTARRPQRSDSAFRPRCSPLPMR